jgi:hypothetical protein
MLVAIRLRVARGARVEAAHWHGTRARREWPASSSCQPSWSWRPGSLLVVTLLRSRASGLAGRSIPVLSGVVLRPDLPGHRGRPGQAKFVTRQPAREARSLPGCAEWLQGQPPPRCCPRAGRRWQWPRRRLRRPGRPLASWDKPPQAKAEVPTRGPPKDRDSPADAQVVPRPCIATGTRRATPTGRQTARCGPGGFTLRLPAAPSVRLLVVLPLSAASRCHGTRTRNCARPSRRGLDEAPCSQGCGPHGRQSRTVTPGPSRQITRRSLLTK